MSKRQNLVLGGIAGGLVGITAALLLAPKSGKKFIEDLTAPFHPKKEKKAAKQKPKVIRKKARSSPVK